MLRIVPENVHIKIDPKKGWNFGGETPEALPAKQDPPAQFNQTKIGTTIEGTESKV